MSLLFYSTWKVRSRFATEQCWLGKLDLQCCTSSNGKPRDGRCRKGRTVRTCYWNQLTRSHAEMPHWQSGVMARISAAPFISLPDECLLSDAQNWKCFRCYQDKQRVEYKIRWIVSSRCTWETHWSWNLYLLLQRNEINGLFTTATTASTKWQMPYIYRYFHNFVCLLFGILCL